MSPETVRTTIGRTTQGLFFSQEAKLEPPYTPKQEHIMLNFPEIALFQNEEGRYQWHFEPQKDSIYFIPQTQETAPYLTEPPPRGNPGEPIAVSAESFETADQALCHAHASLRQLAWEPYVRVTPIGTEPSFSPFTFYLALWEQYKDEWHFRGVAVSLDGQEKDLFTCIRPYPTAAVARFYGEAVRLGVVADPELLSKPFSRRSFHAGAHV